MANSTFASRARAAGKSVQQAENKSVQPTHVKEPTKAELVEQAKAAGIEGYSTMTKAELFEALGG